MQTPDCGHIDCNRLALCSVNQVGFNLILFIADDYLLVLDNNIFTIFAKGVLKGLDDLPLWHLHRVVQLLVCLFGLLELLLFDGFVDHRTGLQVCWGFGCEVGAVNWLHWTYGFLDGVCFTL
jgi:hypothetical protein